MISLRPHKRHLLRCVLFQAHHQHRSDSDLLQPEITVSSCLQPENCSCNAHSEVDVVKGCEYVPATAGHWGALRCSVCRYVMQPILAGNREKSHPNVCHLPPELNPGWHCSCRALQVSQACCNRQHLRTRRIACSMRQPVLVVMCIFYTSEQCNVCLEQRNQPGCANLVRKLL